ncbi:uncharacterized protein C6G9.01c [Nymphaea colorata]|uniref:uncharacterized protein C6G9.01c n=1 Tax=Nymphaea colorata TaxID=210225 RepID=UPI00129E819E|nr:uncharacterized protein C6G9.01c [Nymphaea colorata]
MGKKRVSEQDPQHPSQQTVDSNSDKKQKPSNEIDEIFSIKKKKKLKTSEALPKENTVGEESSSLPKDSKAKKKGKKKASPKGNGSVDPPPRVRKKTADGLTIYSAEELGFDNPDAGGTALCPFDCSCCF